MLTQFQKKRESKKTLYYHFKSKEELILAALRYRDERFRNDFMRVVEEKNRRPHRPLWADYSEEDTTIRRFRQEAKRLTQNYITRLAEKAELQDADELSEQFMLLIEGPITYGSGEQLASQRNKGQKDR